MKTFTNIRAALLLAASISVTGCEVSDGEVGLDPDRADQAAYASCTSTQGAAVPEGLSPHFQEWLQSNGYADYDFNRGDLSGGSFGGFESNSDCVSRDPVIFVHGNSDRAIGGDLGGWQASVDYFIEQGYRRGELYATTYGPADPDQASDYYHSKENLMQVRVFIEAVLEYTGAAKVDIISHSMGVTVSRKAIKGGWASDLLAGGDYDIGEPLTDFVDTFVGIAGGNLGLAACYYTPQVPTCGVTNGFYPGYLWGFAVVGESEFLQDLNSTSGYEGSYRFSIWSTVDQIVGGACLVWGKNTCRVPDHTDEKVFYTVPYGHMGVKSRTAEYQYNMVVNHVVE